jgi:uncharacterized protein
VTLSELQARCLDFASEATAADAAHDVLHIKRVLKNSIYLSEIEDVNAWVTVPAACLHDCVPVAKDSTLRSQGSRLAASAAAEFLDSIDFPAHLLDDVRHAIEAHSYSAGIQPRTPEARVVQDADRLDSLGAIGIARCLLVGGRLDRPLCDADDPFCERRPPDDAQYTLDHFYTKLLKLPATMQTAAGRSEAERRAGLMREYLDALRAEILL